MLTVTAAYDGDASARRPPVAVRKIVSSTLTVYTWRSHVVNYCINIYFSRPSDLDALGGMEGQFKANDVKLLIIGYNVDGSAYSKYPWIKFYQAKDQSDVTVKDILSKYFVTANTRKNQQRLCSEWNLMNLLVHSVCPITSPTVFELAKGQPAAIISVPDNYKGPTDEDVSPTWPPEMTYQAGRYCNFQDNTFVFVRWKRTNFLFTSARNHF